MDGAAEALADAHCDAALVAVDTDERRDDSAEKQKGDDVIDGDEAAQDGAELRRLRDRGIGQRQAGSGNAGLRERSGGGRESRFCLRHESRLAGAGETGPAVSSRFT